MIRSYLNICDDDTVIVSMIHMYNICWPWWLRPGKPLVVDNLVRQYVHVRYKFRTKLTKLSPRTKVIQRKRAEMNNLSVLVTAFPGICVSKSVGTFAWLSSGLKSGGHVPLSFLWIRHWSHHACKHVHEACTSIAFWDVTDILYWKLTSFLCLVPLYAFAIGNVRIYLRIWPNTRTIRRFSKTHPAQKEDVCPGKPGPMVTLTTGVAVIKPGDEKGMN